MSQRMGGCAAAWQAVRGTPESREHEVTGTGMGRIWGGGSPLWKEQLDLAMLGERCRGLLTQMQTPPSIAKNKKPRLLHIAGNNKAADDMSSCANHAGRL